MKVHSYYCEEKNIEEIIGNIHNIAEILAQSKQDTNAEQLTLKDIHDQLISQKNMIDTTRLAIIEDIILDAVKQGKLLINTAKIVDYVYINSRKIIKLFSEK